MNDKAVTNFRIKKINNTNMIGASFKSIDNAQAACNTALSPDTTPALHLQLVSQVNKETIKSFYVAIYDVPLDVDKDIFKLHMQKFGDIKSIWFAINKLFYTVRITYNSYEVTFPKLGSLWSIRFNKDSFRIWPENLDKKAYQQRHNNVLKLTNLPKGTRAYDLTEILSSVNAMTCYIPKKGNTDAYQQDRIAYVAFRSNEDKQKVFAPVLNDQTNVMAPPVFIYNNRALVWTHTADKCCYECGSKFHRIRDCKEHRNIEQRKQNRDRFRPIQQRCGTIPKSKPTPNNWSISRGRQSDRLNPNYYPNYNRAATSYAQALSNGPNQSYPSDDYFYPESQRYPAQQRPPSTSATHKGKQKDNRSSSRPKQILKKTSTSAASSSSSQTELRLSKLEKGLETFVAQISSLTNTVSELQRFIVQVQVDLNTKLDRIISHISSEPDTIEDTSKPVRPTPYSVQEPRTPRKKSDKSLRKSYAQSASAPPIRSFPAPLPQSATETTIDDRISSLSETLQLGLQQVAQTNDNVAALQQSLQRQLSNNPSSHTQPPVTEWSDDTYSHQEYDEVLKDPSDEDI